MQPITREHIEYLAEKKLCGTITHEEEDLLYKWLNHKLKGSPRSQIESPEDEMLRDRLLRRIKADAGISENPRVKHFSIGYRWAVAAAILILVTGTLGYFLLSDREAAPVEVTQNKIVNQDIAPGHNGAILTLANGSKIVLDSTSIGKIAMQGNRSLVKMKGQLVYEEDDKAYSEDYLDKTKNNYNTITTPRGREFQVTLSDGTKVWLNAASSITYPAAFAGGERKVTITGEAYFEVAEDARQPFVVSAGHAKIRVLGTHFDVMAYPEEHNIKTTLLEGAVRVSNAEHKVIIKPGQQASSSNSSERIRVERVDAEQMIAWTKGKLSLDNLGIETIMGKISRWYDVDVEFKGAVPKGAFWGVINRDVSLKNMLKVLKASGINANFEGNKVIVSSAPINNS